MGWVAGLLRSLLLLLDVGGAQVLATGKSTGAETDIKYALIGTALGVAISAGFLALKICMIRKHLFDFDSSDLRSANVGVSDGACKSHPPERGNGMMMEDAVFHEAFLRARKEMPQHVSRKCNGHL